MLKKKLQEFIDENNFKKVEVYDASNLYQCYDLITKWCQTLGLKPPRTLYAYQIFSQDYQQFEKIKNEKDNHPEAGDIVVFSKAYNGTAGHTAIATGEGKTEGKSSDWFEAFSQNDPVGSPSVLKKYLYDYVLGWLRPKREYIKIDNYYRGIDLNNLESVRVAVDTWHQVAVERLFIKKEDHERLIKEKEETIANLNQQLNALNQENTIINQEKNKLSNELKDCQSESRLQEKRYNDLKNEVEVLRMDKVKYEKDKVDWQLKEVELNKRIRFLETKIEGRRKPLKDLLVDIWLKVFKG